MGILRNGAYAFTILALALAGGPPIASAADIWPYIPHLGSYRVIVIEGTIAPGDFDTFVRILRENQGQISGVYCFSPGGDFYEAMKIGRAIRALELFSQAPMRDEGGGPACHDDPKPHDPGNCTCASAGFFIHIGGIHRGGTFLAVHRPYFEKGVLGELSLPDAKSALNDLQLRAQDYMTEMGVPVHVQDDVLGTASDQVLVLDETTVKTYFWGDLSYIHEWMKDKCGVLSDLEKRRNENYSRRLASVRSVSEADLSKAEWVDLDALQKKQDKELKCEISIGNQRRADAYEKYFGTKPTDFGSQNFAKWSEAPRYLRKRFYELLSEENFEQSSMDEISFLERHATANAPYILLRDSNLRPKIVNEVSLLSTPNPSSDFIKHLVTSLESVWGQHSSGNGKTDWGWYNKEFVAKLKLEPGSAEGPYLALRLHAK